MKNQKLIVLTSLFMVLFLGGSISAPEVEKNKQQQKQISDATAGSEKQKAKKSRKKSKTEIKLEKNIAKLQNIYQDRLNRLPNYAPYCLGKIKEMIKDSQIVLKMYQKDEKLHEAIFKSFDAQNIPKDKLARRQELYLKEIPYLDRLSDAILKQNKFEKKHQQSVEKLRKNQDALAKKKIELLETQVKLGGKK